MLRSARMIVGLCLFGGVSLSVVVGWATGFFGQVAAFAAGLWQRLTGRVTGWISSEVGWDHLAAGAGVLIFAAIVLVVIFAIADK